MAELKSPAQLMHEIARRVKTLRLRRNWTREDLAQQSRVNVYSLKRFERTGNISLERLLALCSALGVIEDFERILKPRARINIDEWAVSEQRVRKRGRRKSIKLEVEEAAWDIG